MDGDTSVKVVVTPFLGFMVGLEYSTEDDVLIVDVGFIRIITFFSGYPDE